MPKDETELLNLARQISFELKLDKDQLMAYFADLIKTHKSEIFGTSMPRRSVESYAPSPRTEVCVECNRVMAPSTTEWELPLDLCGRKHTLVITDVPIMKCECGETTHNLDLEIRVEELVDQLALNALRYQKDVPARMSIEEFFN
ncbi:MAG: hypothetical protein P4L59_02420 [Desulfosporosinus sp.]|nr:hypothetical protein [Desulfosporosinus sp.]